MWVAAAGNEPGYLLFSDIPSNSIMSGWRVRVSRLFLKPAGYTGQIGYGNEPARTACCSMPRASWSPVSMETAVCRF